MPHLQFDLNFAPKPQDKRRARIRWKTWVSRWVSRGRRKGA